VTETGIDGFHRLDGGGQAAGVADHVEVGVVQHDRVVFLRVIAVTTLSVSSGPDISGCRS
jgi:hypothetical protein